MLNRFFISAANTIKRPVFSKTLSKPFLLEISRMSSKSASFEEAQSKVKTLKQDPTNEVKLNLYALYKQASEGLCSQTKPSMLDMVGKAKWNAWNSLGSMSQEEAKRKYISLVDELLTKEQDPSNSSESSSEFQFEGLIYKVGPNITEIIMNRPSRKNAINLQMYRDIALALKKAGENDTAVTLLTGSGDFFSSGNDLSNFMEDVKGDLELAAKNGGKLFHDFVAAFIDFPKILVVAVNGPAIGLTVTMLGLCDIVYASDKATFSTPFVFLGQTPECCSTFTFHRLMGTSKANEILLCGKKFTAHEAKELGLVAEVFPHNSLHEKVLEKLSFLPDASKQSLIYTKQMVRGLDKEILHKVNKMECDRLVERWQSTDFIESIMKFFQRRSKL